MCAAASRSTAPADVASRMRVDGATVSSASPVPFRHVAQGFLVSPDPLVLGEVDLEEGVVRLRARVPLQAESLVKPDCRRAGLPLQPPDTALP